MDERKEEYVYEYWDCPRCGNKGIRGDFRVCSQCGFTRGDTIKFYRKEQDELVADNEQVDNFKKGPDWVCSYCGSLISQKDGKCGNCGVTRDDSVKNYFDLQKSSQDAGSGGGDDKDKTEDVNKGKGGRKKILAIGGMAILAIAAILIWGFSKKDIPYMVKAVNWERSIPIERYDWTQRADWEDEIKGDDINVFSRKTEVRRYEKRQVGSRTEYYTENEKYQSSTKKECSTTYTSTGSGASKKVTDCKDVPVYSTRNVSKSREVPVYKDFPVFGVKVSYRSKIYALRDTGRKSGNDNSPKWPEINISSGLDNKPDREGQRSEKYNVTIKKLKDKDKGPREAVFSTNLNLFEKKYTLNKELLMKISNFGSLIYEKDEKEISSDK